MGSRSAGGSTFGSGIDSAPSRASTKPGADQPEVGGEGGHYRMSPIR